MCKALIYKGVSIVNIYSNLWIVKAGVEPEFTLLSDAKSWVDNRTT
jgi:hypothetical protein